MQFRLISDVHNEFFNESNQYELPVIPGESEMILIIAGDFTMLKKARQASGVITDYASRFKHVLYVPGNHEYYGGRIDDRKNHEQFLEMNPLKLDNVHFMRRKSIAIEGIRFIGATLWTDMNNRCPITEWDLQMKMNDFKAITYFDQLRNNYGKYKVRNWLNEHTKDFLFIRQELEEAQEEQIVVISHHAPSTLSKDDRYLEDRYGVYGYCNNLEDFILSHPKIKYWCHGHVHQKQDYFIGGTNVVCNPHGYIINGEETGFYDKEVYTI